MREDDNWKVTMVDYEERFEPDICEDMLNLEPDDFEEDYDLIWASPPCDRFTVAQIGRYWAKVGGISIPNTPQTVERIHLVYHTLWLINKLGPTWWFLENPRGMLRNVIGRPTGTITYCQYGGRFMKPTDLWGVHPPSFVYKACNPNDECHEPNPRGAGRFRDGFKTPEERAKVPYGLSKAIKKAVENPKSKEKLEAFC